MIAQRHQRVADIAHQNDRPGRELGHQFEVRADGAHMLLADDIHAPGIDEPGHIDVLFGQVVLTQEETSEPGDFGEARGEKRRGRLRHRRHENAAGPARERAFEREVDAQAANDGGLARSFETLAQFRQPVPPR